MNKIEKNLLEWGVFTVGLVLVLATTGYLAYQSWTARSTPPRVEVQLGAVSQQGNQYVMPVTLLNRGSKTAEDVSVEVILHHGGEKTERAEMQVPYLPGGASRKGWVAFHADPRTAQEITARPLGYQEP